MNKYKLRQPLAVWAGIFMLLGNLLWFVFSGLPMGEIGIISNITSMLEFFNVALFMDDLLCVLIFLVWLFAAIALFTASPKASSVAFILLGVLYAADCIIIVAFWQIMSSLMYLFTAFALILTGLAIGMRKKGLRVTAIIMASAGFVAYISFRIVNLIQMVSPGAETYMEPSQHIASTVLCIIGDIMLLLAMILANASSKEKKAKAGAAAGYAGQPYQQSYNAQWQQPYAGQAQQPYQQPYAGQAQQYAQPSPYAGQPQQPYTQPSPYAGQQPYQDQNWGDE